MIAQSKDKFAVVRSHDVKLDNDYVQWLYDVRQRYRSAQIKAAVKINSEQLLIQGSHAPSCIQKSVASLPCFLFFFCQFSGTLSAYSCSNSSARYASLIQCISETPSRIS